MYGIGISREGSLIDLGVEQGIVRKSGAWYTYEGDQLGQGKENARNFLRENEDMANEIEKRIKEKLGVGARLDADATASGPRPPATRPCIARRQGRQRSRRAAEPHRAARRDPLAGNGPRQAGLRVTVRDGRNVTVRGRGR